MADLSTLRSTGTLTLLPTDLSDETYEAGVRFTRIRERVLDGTLRERLKEFHEFVSAAELLAVRLKDQPPATALPRFEATQGELALRYQEVSDRLGVSLREILGA
jgi:hypothetical protein